MGFSSKIKVKYIVTSLVIIGIIYTAIVLNQLKPDLVTEAYQHRMDSLKQAYGCLNVEIKRVNPSKVFGRNTNYKIIMVDFSGCKDSLHFDDILNNKSLANREAEILFFNLKEKANAREIELRFNSTDRALNSVIFTYLIKGDSLELHEVATTQPGF